LALFFRRNIIFLYLFIFACLSSASLLASPSWTEKELNSNGGYFVLSWKKDPDRKIELQESLFLDFSKAEIIYTGKDSASAMSGKKNGMYYYRIRYTDSDSWSDACIVQVEHHSLFKAFLFMTAGALVFFSTLGLLLYEGFWKPSSEEGEGGS